MFIKKGKFLEETKWTSEMFMKNEIIYQISFKIRHQHLNQQFSTRIFYETTIVSVSKYYNQ